MYLFSLAIIPAIVLLVYIYKKDTVEKEPASLLAKCFFAGVLCIIPVVIWEEALNYLLIKLPGIGKGSIPYAAITGFLVAGFCEESCKFFVLKKLTWKNKNFDYMFDGIVYAVFVSIGFAAIENIFYVFDGGVRTAILRIFTAVPGHACYGVFMGFYYGAAKQASVEGRAKDCKATIRSALTKPILLHGIYDALIMTNATVVGNDFNKFLFIAWIAFVIELFKSSFKLVNDASKYDQRIFKRPKEIPEPEKDESEDSKVETA